MRVRVRVRVRVGVRVRVNPNPQPNPNPNPNQVLPAHAAPRLHMRAVEVVAGQVYVGPPLVRRREAARGPGRAPAS